LGRSSEYSRVYNKSHRQVKKEKHLMNYGLTDIYHLNIFGSKINAHIPKAKRRKFYKKGRKGVFVGYSEEIMMKEKFHEAEM